MQKEIYPSVYEVSQKAAADAIDTLSRVIKKKGRVNWALAGGSSPMLAYEILAQKYSEAIDWSKVNIFISDERCVNTDHPDSNWGQISKVLFSNESIGRANTLAPQAELGPDKAAALYSELLLDKLLDEDSVLVIDLLWLGVGEDGHTLSLFPGHPALADNSAIVVPVHDSPKPPSGRITLSFAASAAASKLVVFAVGSAKQKALAQVNKDPESLPLGRVVRAAHKSGADILWLYDEAADIIDTHAHTS